MAPGRIAPPGACRDGQDFKNRLKTGRKRPISVAGNILKRIFSYLHARQGPPLASPSGETTVYAEPTASASSNSSNPVAASSVSLAVLIPAYQPNSALIELVEALRRQESARWAGIVVVNDGSGADYNAVFEAVSQLPSVTVLRHAINLGKGAALKTGLNYILYKHPEVAGIVTADADGQHDPADVARVAAQLHQSRGAPVLGARQLDAPVPLRRAIGDRIPPRAVRAPLGRDVTDTATRPCASLRR